MPQQHPLEDPTPLYASRAQPLFPAHLELDDAERLTLVLHRAQDALDQLQGQGQSQAVGKSMWEYKGIWCVLAVNVTVMFRPSVGVSSELVSGPLRPTNQWPSLKDGSLTCTNLCASVHVHR